VRADQRTHFETWRIACDGDEPGFPDPLQDVDVRLHAEESGGCGGHCLARGGGEQGVVAGEAGAEEEDVAGAGLDAGFAEHGFEVGSADVAGGEGVNGFLAVLGEVAGVVEDYAAGGDAAGVGDAVDADYFGLLDGLLGAAAVV
jgi:hypothetical protein